jgi:hypothetical protein
MPPALFCFLWVFFFFFFGDKVLPFAQARPLWSTVHMYHHTQLLSTEMGFQDFFCPGWPGTKIHPISASSVAWDNRYLTRNLAIGWDGGLWTCRGRPWTAILLISASQVARITGVSYQYPVDFRYLEKLSTLLFFLPSSCLSFS